MNSRVEMTLLLMMETSLPAGLTLNHRRLLALLQRITRWDLQRLSPIVVPQLQSFCPRRLQQISRIQAVHTLKVLGRGLRFQDFFGAQTETRKEGFLHVALTTIFNNCLPWHALGPCIHSLNRNRTDVTGKSVRIF